MTTRSAKGAVAAGHKITAQAAAEILEDGGNAYDAVIAALIASTVAEPVFASLGGGGSLMARTAQSTTARLYDFFVSTPLDKHPESELDFRSVHAQFGPATQEFHIGLGATAIPGFVPGIFRIHRDLCTLPMERLVEPAITAAKSGVTLTGFQAYLLTVVRPIVTDNEKIKTYFAPKGDLLKQGDILKNPKLADTLETLAKEGLVFFTKGEAAQAIARQSETHGGHLSLRDLETYQTIIRDPLSWRYRSTDIALNPPPAASGALIAFGLGFLQNASPNSAPNMNDLIAAQTATNHARDQWPDLTTTVQEPDAIFENIRALSGLTPASNGTTHISVIDADGNAASATTTNGEGNGHIVGELGFMLNNMLGEEDLNPAGFHQWTPGERLSTMMAPTIAAAPDGAITTLGSGGSNRIRTAVLQTIVNLIDHNMPLAQAVTAPRIHLEKCATLSFEDEFSDQVRDAIFANQPNAKAWPECNFFFGGVNAVTRDSAGNLTGCADPRRDGFSLVV